MTAPGVNSGSSRYGYLFSSPSVHESDGAVGSLPHTFPYIRWYGGGIYVEEAGVSANEKGRNAVVITVRVDKGPHVWDKRRDNDVLEASVKNALFYKQIAKIVIEPNERFLFT